MLHTSKNCLLIIPICLCLFGCGKISREELISYDNTEEVDAYYSENQERFVFASTNDLPKGLNWEDGSNLTPYGDPRAKRGGRLYLRLNTMQQTLRVVGPDANASLRGPLWSANSVWLIEKHPWEDGYMPGLAKQWAVDPDDNRTTYFKLDPDARWSDGSQFTVEDVFFSLYFLLSPHINDPAINGVFDENITRITQYDQETFSITQTKASPEPLYSMSTFILSQREFYREFGPDYVDRYHWRFAPVTGAYTVEPDSVKRGQQITFDRLENWWADDKPFYRHRFNPEKLTFVIIRDDNKAFEAFLNGQIAWHPLNRTELWYDRKEVQPIRNGYIERAWLYHRLPAARAGVYMNAMDPILTDRNLRIGIQHSINYEWVNQGLYRGDRRRINTFADGYDAYSNPTLTAREFDVDMALNYFADAGFRNRGNDGILVNENGQRLSLEFTVANRVDEVNVASILKEEAQKAGLELRIEALDSTAFFTKTFEKNYQVAIHGWNTGYSPLPAFEWELRGKDAGKPKNFNTTNIKNEQLDALLEKWDQLSDPVQAQIVSHAVQDEIHEFAAWVPGLTMDYARLGYWRWIQWPDYFQVPRYFYFMASGVFWIDEELMDETLQARKDGDVFTPKTQVYDRWKQN